MFPNIQRTNKGHCSKKNHNGVKFIVRGTPEEALSEMLRTGVQHLIHRAIEAELESLFLQHANQVTRDDKAAVVRNGYLPAREILTGIRLVTVRIPKILTHPVSKHNSLSNISNGTTQSWTKTARSTSWAFWIYSGLRSEEKELCDHWSS